jgi:imidazolonepropionase-like amidohydrolase
MEIRKSLMIIAIILLNAIFTGAQTTAFVRVNVIPMDKERILTNQTVIVRKGVISRIGVSGKIRIPADAVKIDGRGKYLMPGLVDFHVHLRDKSELASYLLFGVTTVVHMSGPTGNVPDIIALRKEIRDNKLLGPNIYTTGRILDGDPPIYPGVSTAISTPEEAKKAVEEQYRAGVDFIKVYNNLSSVLLTAIIEAAHQRGLAVLGHIPRHEGRQQAMQTALNSKLDMIAHSEEFFFTYFYGDIDNIVKSGRIPQLDLTEIPRVVNLVKDSGTAVTPNLSFVAMTRRQIDNFDSVLSDPEIKYLHPDVLAMWRNQNPTLRPDFKRFDLREKGKYSFLQKLVPALQNGGVLLLLGTDSSASGLFPGKSAHLELQELVKAQLTPFQTLTIGTRNAGEFIKSHVKGADIFGKVSIGQRADLILLNANPLESIDNIAKIAGISLRGRWLSRRRLEKIRNQELLSQ